MMVLKLLLSLLLILLLPVSKTEYTIHIDPETGYNSPTCLSGEINCATLEYAINGINDSTTIVLAYGVHLVDNEIYMSDVNNITLISSAVNADQVVGTVLHCDGSNAGLKFVRITNLSISGVQVENCGALTESTSRVNLTSMAIFRAAVYVLNSTDVNIESSAFINNKGIGLVLFDVNGYVSVQNSNFTNNYVPEQ